MTVVQPKPEVLATAQTAVKFGLKPKPPLPRSVPLLLTSLLASLVLKPKPNVPATARTKAKPDMKPKALLSRSAPSYLPTMR